MPWGSKELELVQAQIAELEGTLKDNTDAGPATEWLVQLRARRDALLRNKENFVSRASRAPEGPGSQDPL
jgi:hypothetical protein